MEHGSTAPLHHKLSKELWGHAWRGGSETCEGKSLKSSTPFTFCRFRLLPTFYHHLIYHPNILTDTALAIHCLSKREEAFNREVPDTSVVPSTAPPSRQDELPVPSGGGRTAGDSSSCARPNSRGSAPCAPAETRSRHPQA